MQNHYLQGILGQVDAMRNAFPAATPGNTVLEKLQFKKKSYELNIQQLQEQLDAVNKAIAKLEADPNLESVLAALGKANII